MNTISEVYFLVRTGVWSESDLDDWLTQHQDLVRVEMEQECNYEIQQVRESTWSEAYNEGYNLALIEMRDHARYLEK